MTLRMTDLKEQSQLRTWISSDRQFVRLPMIISGDKRRGILAVDKLVYHLYGLTNGEVKVIAPNTPITRKEYEK